MAAKPTNDDEKRRWELYDNYRKDTNASIASSSDDFDKSVLTYSSAGLGVSIAFVKDIVVLKNAVSPWMLYLSWAAFCLAIVLTTTSFLVSMKAHMRSLKDAEQYYLKNDPAYQNKYNPYDKLNTCLVRVAGASFISAVVFTVSFAYLNLNQESQMSKPPIHIPQSPPSPPIPGGGRPVSPMPPAPPPPPQK